MDGHGCRKADVCPVGNEDVGGALCADAYQKSQMNQLFTRRLFQLMFVVTVV